MGTPLGPKYIPYTYMDPLGKDCHFLVAKLKRYTTCKASITPTDGLGFRV